MVAQRIEDVLMHKDGGLTMKILGKTGKDALFQTSSLSKRKNQKQISISEMVIRLEKTSDINPWESP